MVVKKSGDCHPCGDYRTLNDVTKPDRYPISHIQDFTATLQGSTIIFSLINLVQAYHKIPVEPADVPKMAVATLFVLFEFVRMPFGLCNAAQIFQRFVEQFFEASHLLTLTSTISSLPARVMIFQRLDEYSIVINSLKSVF